MVVRWLTVMGMAVGVCGCAAMDSLVKGMEKPTARIVGVKISELRLESAVLGFEVEVSNPYSVALPLTNVEYGLASGGAAFLSGKAEAAGAVPAKGSKVISMPAKVEFVKLIETVKGIRPGAVVPYEASVRLSVDAPGVGPVSLPLSKSGELPVPVAPSIELSEVKWRSLSFEKAEALLRVKVGNGNQFAAELSKVGMKVSLGGHPIGTAEITKAARFEAGGECVVEIPVSFAPKELGLAAFGLLRGDGSEYKISGVMKVDTAFGVIAMPYEKTGETKFGR